MLQLQQFYHLSSATHNNIDIVKWSCSVSLLPHKTLLRNEVDLSTNVDKDNDNDET